jgi:hypothetical protein
MGVFVFFAPLLLCGCAYHRVGWNRAPRQTVYVLPIAKFPEYLGIHSTLRQRLIQEINACPGFGSGPMENAELILTVKIEDFFQSIGTTMPRDSDVAHSYTITLMANCEIAEKDTQKEILPGQTIQATVTVPAHPSFTEAKRQAATQISGILAKKICNFLLNSAPLS